MNYSGKKTKKIYVVIGRPIPYTTFMDGKNYFEIAQEIKETVYGLKNQLISEIQTKYN